MTRKGNTVLAAALKRYGGKIKKYIQDCIGKPLTVKVLIEDARDSAQKTSGAISIEIEIEKPGGWGDYNIIEIHGTVGLEKAGKPGKKEDEAYLDGVTVGDWDEGSKAIGLNGCSIGEFLVHMFTLFAIKAGNESVLLDNAAGPRGEHIYKQVGFIKSKGDRAQYGEDNEMIFSLTGKKKNKDAGQLWRERYNKFRKKLKTKIKNSAKCKTFWKCVPPALEAPGPVHAMARGSKRRTRKKRGGDAERPPITLNKQQFINMVKNNPDKVYKIIRNLGTEGMDDPDDPDYGFNVWYNGKIEYEGFDEDWGHVFGFTMYDEDGDEIRWSDIYKSLKTGPDTDALDYEWINIKDEGQPIKFVGGKRRKKKTRKKRGGRNETNQNIYYIIQNNAENIRRFQEQVFSPDANAEDAEGFNNLILMMENAEDAGGFWIVEYSLTRDLDDNYHHYHLAWENNIPDINDNPDLENAIPFINDEQNGGGKRRAKTRKKRGGAFTVNNRVKLTRDVMHRGYLFRENMVGTIIEVNAEDNTYLVEFDEPRDWNRKLGRRYRILSLNNNDIELAPDDVDVWSDSDEESDNDFDDKPPPPRNHNIAAGRAAAGGKRKKKTRKKRGGNGKDNKTKKKKETRCAGIKNAFGQCMTAANKTTAFNKSVVDAQDTSLGQFKTDNPSILMGFPSGKGGGRRRKTRKKRGGNLGPGDRVKLKRTFRSFKKGMVAHIEHVEEEESDANPDEPPEIWYVVQFVEPAGWDMTLGLQRRLPAEWFESYPEEEKSGGKRKRRRTRRR